MGTLLTLAVSAYFFIISYRLKFTYFLFVFLIPLIPKYIGFGVGSEGFALSLKRILLMILFMAFVLSFSQHKKYISQRISMIYQQNNILINTLLLFFTIKIFSLTINDRELSQYITLFDDFLFTIFIIILTILFIDSEEAIHRLVKVFFYGYTIVLILALIESIIKIPLLSIFYSGQMAAVRDVSEALIRDGGYRVIGSFENPIVLGNYMVALFPVIFTYMHINKYSLVFKVIYILLIVYTLYSTGSRSAILMFSIIIYLYFILFMYRNVRQFTRLIIIILNLTFISFITYFTIVYVSDLIMNFSGRFDKIADEEVRSSTARALQYVSIYDKMHEAPFFGFGRKRNFTTAFTEELHIDNYYFWVILEVGIVGILIYLLFFYTLIKTAWNQYKLPYKNYYLLSVLISLIVLILYQILSAVKDNQIYLYIFVGLISIMKVMQNEKIKNIKKDLT